MPYHLIENSDKMITKANKNWALGKKHKGEIVFNFSHVHTFNKYL